jgi:hypothetical protein
MVYPTILNDALNEKLEKSSQRAGVVAVLTAVCVSTNYLLIGVTNVKLMDLIVFTSGFIFGTYVGASVGLLTWLVYGTLNPYGFSLPILAATCAGESLYGVAGGLLGTKIVQGSYGKDMSSILFINTRFAIIGFLLTFIYDLFTNIVSGVVAGIPIMVALISGIPFAIAHEVSNTAFFFVGASPLIRAMDRLFLEGNV